METLSETVETVLWGATWAALLLGLVLRMGEVVGGAMMRLWREWRTHRSLGSHTQARAVITLAAGVFCGALMVMPAPGWAGQGFWWGSQVNPGFDRNTVVQMTGTAVEVDIAPRGGPSALTLQTASERVTVMLGPGWYLDDQKADIRSGDPLVVEGSKMMDRRGHLHLVAARVTNQRTGAILHLRDDAGRPLWTGKPGWKR